MGSMVCQACQTEMPFKLGNGDYYFEEVQAVKGLAKHFCENRLALCPTCAAMYQHVRSGSDEELTQQISATVAAGGAVELQVGLAAESRVLRFVGTHFSDLQALLSSSPPGNGDELPSPD